MRLDDRIMDIAARKHVGERMANEFADTQLAWRETCGLITMLMITSHLFLCRAWA